MARWGESAAAAPEVVVAAYHAPVPDSHTPFALDMGRVLHAAHRFRGDWPSVYTRWPVPREA